MLFETEKSPYGKRESRMPMQREELILFSLIGLYTVWVLMPMVPAIIIYRLFPNTAVAVSGPLAGLTVRASGAFAAYLILFVVAYPWLVSRAEDAISGFQHQFWTIRGQVKLEAKNGGPLESEALLKQIVLKTDPSPYRSDGDAESYSIRMNVPEEAELPTLIFEIPGFGRHTVDLMRSSSDISISIDNYHKVMEIKTPIIIKETSIDPILHELRPTADNAPRVSGAPAR
jgi:hypothetical protein